jgi:hypothetical protein
MHAHTHTHIVNKPLQSCSPCFQKTTLQRVKTGYRRLRWSIIPCVVTFHRTATLLMKVWYCNLFVQLKPVRTLTIYFFANKMYYVLPACRKYFQYTGDSTMVYTVSWWSRSIHWKQAHHRGMLSSCVKMLKTRT